MNLLLNQDLPVLPINPILLKQNSMPAGSILKNARPRIEPVQLAVDVQDQHQDHRALRLQLERILQQTEPELPLGRNHSNDMCSPWSLGDNLPASAGLARIGSDDKPSELMQSWTQPLTTGRLNTDTWYLAASDEEYFDPTPEPRAYTNTASTCLETPGLTERELRPGEQMMAQLYQNQAHKSRNGLGGARPTPNGVHRSMFYSYQGYRGSDRRLPPAHPLASTMTFLPPPAPRTPLSRAGKIHADTTLHPIKNTTLRNTTLSSFGPKDSLGQNETAPVPSLSLSARGAGPSVPLPRIKIKKIKIPRLKANKAIYDVFKEL